MTWRKFVKRAVAPVAMLSSSSTRTPEVILCYHSVGLRAAPEVVAVDMLRRHLDLLQNNYHVVRVAELVASIGDPANPLRPRVAVTFDDGYKGVLHHALPLLLERGLHAAAYVLPGLWGGTASWPSGAPFAHRALWNVEDAQAWVGAGMSLGSHGLSHVDLSSAPLPVIKEEVAGSKRLLEEICGEVDGFCYPWGRASVGAMLEVEAAGYRYGLAAGYSRHHARENLFALGRIPVDHEDTVEDLQMKLRGGYDWLDGVGRLRSKVAWRSP